MTEKQLREVFANNLKGLRIAKGLSQTDIATAIEKNRSFVSDLERAQHNPTLRTLAHIAIALDVPASELLTARKKYF